MAGEMKGPGEGMILMEPTMGLSVGSPYTRILAPAEVQEKRIADLEAGMQALQARVDALEKTLKEPTQDVADVKAEEPQMTASLFTRRKEAVPPEVRERLRKGENPLRIYREYRGLTGQELANRTGVSQAYISQLETDRRAGTTEVMKKIAEVLDVSLDRLV